MEDVEKMHVFNGHQELDKEQQDVLPRREGEEGGEGEEEGEREEREEEGERGEGGGGGEGEGRKI